MIFMAVSADVLLRKKAKLDGELRAREKPVRMLSRGCRVRTRQRVTVISKSEIENPSVQ